MVLISAKNTLKHLLFNVLSRKRHPFSRNIPHNQFHLAYISVIVVFTLLFPVITCADSFLTQQEQKWLNENNETITFAVDTNYAPMSFLDETGNFIGLTADYLKLIESRINVTFERKLFDKWSTLMDSARKQEVDILGSIHFTPERSEYLKFTDPYITIPNAIIVRKSFSDMLTLDQMDTMSIAVVKDYAYVDYLKKNASLDLRYSDDCPAGLQMVSFGLVDAMVVDLAIASHAIEKLKLTNLKAAGVIDFSWQLRFAVRSDLPELHSLLNKAMASITTEEKNAIFNKWIVLGNYKEELPRKVKTWLLYSFTAMLIIISLVFTWILTLKRQIAYRTSQLWQELKVRKRTEAALKKSETRSRQLSNASWEAIVIHMNGTLLQANSRFYDLFGYKRDSLTGVRFLPKTVVPEAVDQISDYIGTGDPEPFRTSGKHKTGRRFPIEIQTKSIEFNGKDARVTAIRDITDIKRQEDELKKWEHIFNNAEIGIVVSEEGSNTLGMMNPAFAKMLGYSIDELKGIYAWKLFPKGSYHELDSIIRNVNKNDQGIFETRFLKKDGTVLPVSGHATSVRGDDDEVSYYIVNVMDISQMKELEKLRHETENQLRHAQKMEAIGTLAGGVAHDFNNILYPIIGYSELLLMDSEEGTRHYDCLTGIVNSAKRAKDLVNQILAFSRQTEHQLSPQKVQDILNETLKLARSTLPSTITIHESVDQNCPLIMADHTQIHQIIMNLITNAFHAMEQDGGTLGVSLKKTVITEPQCLEMNLRIGSYIVLSISDTGSGIDPAIMPRLFEPYFTTKTNGKGTGLGLSVVHGIVRDYSGHIDISSKPGEGTCFTVYLPVMDKEKQAVQISETDEIRGGTERILVVDDEEQITSMLEESLKRLGYTVTSQSTGNEALDTLTRIPDQFDLVISDVTMPGITGDKLVRKIHEIRPDIPVVLCTGFEGRLTKEEIQAFGVTDFLMKPISRKDLARSIRNVLDKQY